MSSTFAGWWKPSFRTLPVEQVGGQLCQSGGGGGGSARGAGSGRDKSWYPLTCTGCKIDARSSGSGGRDASAARRKRAQRLAIQRQADRSELQPNQQHGDR
eukprot:4213530-Prymnesium_polylepis.1